MTMERQVLDLSLAFDRDEAQLVTSLPRLDGARLRGYRRLLNFYNGDQWTSVRRASERRLTLNYAKVLVEKVSSYLMASRRVMADAEGYRASAVESALASVELSNGLDALDWATELDAAVLGDGCYKVTWDSALDRVRVTAPDVQGIWAWWLPDDVGRVWRVAQRYQVDREGARRLRLTLSSSVAWVTEVWTAETFGLYVDGALVRRTMNPYGFLPYVLFPNKPVPKRLWGESDIEAVIEPSRELNRAFTQVSRILELSGNPITVLEGVDKSDDIAATPGAIWELPEKARAYLLDLLQHGGVRLHVEYIEALRRVLHDLSEAPRTSFGDAQPGSTGIAIELELTPLIQKVARKRLTRGPAYLKRAELILRLLDQFTGTRYWPVRLSLSWSEITPRDVSRLVDDERLLVGIGLSSRSSAMSRLGEPDPAGEIAKWLAEQQAIAEVGANPAVADATTMGAGQERRNR